MPSTRPEEVADEFWERVRPLIPPASKYTASNHPQWTLLYDLYNVPISDKVLSIVTFLLICDP